MQITSAILNTCLHAVGKTTDTLDSRIQPWSVLNQAGRALFTRYPWSWRNGNREVAAVSGQEFVTLPTDFAKAEVVTVLAGPFGVEVVTRKRIMEMRQSAATFIGSGGVQYVSFTGWDSQANSESLPTPRMDIYPTPTADGSPTFSLDYQRQWRELRVVDANAFPNIPDAWAWALILKGRAMFKALHDDYTGAQVDEAFYEAECQRLIQEDTPQMNHGRMRGGADDCPKPGQRYRVPYVQSVTWS